MCKLVNIKTNYNSKITVAEIKSKTLEAIIEIAKKCNKIDSIILFGSVLEERCTIKSDIDISIIMNTSRSKLFKSRDYDEFLEKLYAIDTEQTYDILYFNSVEEVSKRQEGICKEIKNKGKMIYRRTA